MPGQEKIISQLYPKPRPIWAWVKRHHLAIIVGAVFLKQVALAFIIPVWQVPDETDHFQYVQTIVEQKVWPVFSNNPMPYSREVIDSFNAMAGNFHGRLPIFNRTVSYTTPENIPYRWAGSDSPPNNAALYGPAYYLYEAIPYLILYNTQIDTRLQAMRIWSSLLLVALVLVAYRVALRARSSQGFAAATAVIIGFHPMLGYVSAGVNNDALFNLLGGIAFGLLLVQRLPAGYRTAMFLGVLAGLTMATKQAGWIFIVAVAWKIWWAAGQTGLSVWRRIRLAATAVTVGSLVGASWSIISFLSGGNDFIRGTGLPIRTDTLPPTFWNIFSVDAIERTRLVFYRFWGSYGWSGSVLDHPSWAYQCIAAIGLISIIGLLAGKIFRRPDHEPLPFRQALWIGAGLWFLLDIFYRAIFWQRAMTYHTYTFPVQGRYYFVLIIPVVMILLYGLDRPWPLVKKPWVWAAATAGLLLLAGGALGLLLQWYNLSLPVT